MDILQKKKEKLLLLKDKIKDSERSVHKLFLDLTVGMSRPAIVAEIKEKLNIIISGLKPDMEYLSQEIISPRKAFKSVLDEISEMPGSYDQLTNLLESQDGFIASEKEVITRAWTAQFSSRLRILKFSEPHDDSESKEFLQSKVADITKAREDYMQNFSSFEKMNDVLTLAYNAVDTIDLLCSEKQIISADEWEDWKKCVRERSIKYLAESAGGVDNVSSSKNV